MTNKKPELADLGINEHQDPKTLAALSQSSVRQQGAGIASKELTHLAQGAGSEDHFGWLWAVMDVHTNQPSKELLEMWAQVPGNLPELVAVPDSLRMDDSLVAWSREMTLSGALTNSALSEAPLESDAPVRQDRSPLTRGSQFGHPDGLGGATGEMTTGQDCR